MPLENVIYILVGINTKSFWNIHAENYCAALRILYPFIKSLASLLVDIASVFFDSSFNSLSTSTFVVLFEATILFAIFSLSLKVLFYSKLAISL